MRLTTVWWLVRGNRCREKGPWCCSLVSSFGREESPSADGRPLGEFELAHAKHSVLKGGISAIERNTHDLACDGRLISPDRGLEDPLPVGTGGLRGPSSTHCLLEVRSEE